MIGFLNIYKPSGITSNAVVQKVRKHFNIKKIGHLGTLDPIACGVLPLAIGKATRLFDYSLDKNKVYNAVFEFGYTTDSLDSTGNVTIQNGLVPYEQEILNILPNLTGKISQIPPNFSAKNIDGRRAYDLAREGLEFELKPKEIEIYSIELLEKINDTSYKFRISCSSGTYIRAIARDMGALLNTHACMTYLERCETGVFNIDNSIKLEEALQLSNIEDKILSPLDVFKNFDIIELNDIMYKKIRHGIKVDDYKVNKNSFLIYNGNLIGVSKPNNYLKLDTFLDEEDEVKNG